MKNSRIFATVVAAGVLGVAAGAGTAHADDQPWALQNSLGNQFCVGIGNSMVNGGKVIQYACNHATDEHWWFLDTKDGNGNPAFYLQNDFSGRCMGVGSSLASGAGVIQYTCNGAVDEKWWYSGVGILRNVYSGLCLAPASGSGAQLIQRKCTNFQDQTWEKQTS